VDPFKDLNRRIAEQSDQVMSKREYFACHILGVLLKQNNPKAIELSIWYADTLMKELKETPPHG
jgi:hypothetical protein